ncbi:DNA polymerase I [Borrelia miyamotoi]|uniref:DNA polymerase I n=2 Tax=Borrelia miyamotoi TaxID=47466 RepID=A0AAP8YUH9_9SPIR|nr:DNA polymerase I [Borrelia miyamotoi]AHH04862.1 DNA polymerase I [Borrelia miyamotoi FR64b]AHH05601.1 DNA polymerase I [Borrelia miyamotoi FR64b]ATQ14686.1 DNA polymerase I [Borrelia miyamotoi]ATQ15870.1 DNA polymerase I [Borrelia miyamotoi]ATQ17014.1 DNA polymerase I [Borrelia miyamotoi]
MKEIYLIDALNIIFRNYHVMKDNPLINSKGENVNAFIGFFKTLFFIIKDKNPESLIVTFDSETQTFRQQKYPSYKATRDAPPDNLIPQIYWIKEALLRANIPMFEIKGYEADDLIASFSKKAESNNYLTYIISPDKDLLQLMSSQTKIFKIENSSFIEMDNNYVMKKFGIDKSQIKSYLSIVGDRSDNIPGIKGIGKKGAVKLLNEFQTLNGIYENLDSINNRYKEILLKEKKNAFLSYELISLVEDLELPALEKFKLENLKEDIISLLEEYSATTLIKSYKDILRKRNIIISQTQRSIIETNTTKLNQIDTEVLKKTSYPPNTLKTIQEENIQYETILTKEQLDTLIEKLKSTSYVAIDTETTSLNVHEAQIIGISVSFKELESYYIPIETKEKKYIEKEYIIQKFNEFFKTKPKLIGQNYKFDYKILKKHGFNIIPPYFDTIIAAYIINPNTKTSLDFLAEKYLMHKNIRYEDIVVQKGTLKDIPLDIVSNYASEDADITFRLFTLFTKKLKEENLESLMMDIEMPFSNVITEMEENGIYLDKDYLRQYGHELDKELKLIENDVIKSIGIKFNLNSTKQLYTVLFKELNLTIPKNVKKNSTNIKVLEGIKDQHESIEKIIQHRHLVKLKSTYTDNLIKFINKKTNKIHTNFIQTKTATGRISSTKPNLQNIPIKDEKGRKIRKAFKPGKGNVFISADYSQIELVILAHLSEDEALIEAFENKKDIHKKTASQLFKVNEDKVTSSMRRIAKSINFGIIYKMSAYRLSQELSIKREEAQKFIDSYFNLYSKTKTFITKQIDFVRKNGYSETLLKRRRYIKEINSQNCSERSDAERMAINSIIQGSASDIMKIAMIKVYNEFKSKNLKSKILLQVHDEMLIESPEQECEEVKKIIKEIMENAYPLKLPLKANIETGKSWGEIHQ